MVTVYAKSIVASKLRKLDKIERHFLIFWRILHQKKFLKRPFWTDNSEEMTILKKQLKTQKRGFYNYKGYKNSLGQP